MANIVKKYSIQAKGILVLDEEDMGIEVPDSGEFVDFRTLLSDFADKPVKISVNYDEEYGSDAE
jgi:hypothetical protein